MTHACQPAARGVHHVFDLFQLGRRQRAEPEVFGVLVVVGKLYVGGRRLQGVDAGERLGLEAQRAADFILLQPGDRFRRQAERLRPEFAGEEPGAARPRVPQPQRGLDQRRQIVGRRPPLSRTPASAAVRPPRRSARTKRSRVTSRMVLRAGMGGGWRLEGLEIEN